MALIPPPEPGDDPVTDDVPFEDSAVRHRLDAAREVERLVAANAASNATMTRLVERVRQDAEKRERKIELLEGESQQIRRLLIMVGAAITLLLVLAVFNATTIAQARENAAQTAAVAKNAEGTYKLLYGCFDPNSQCSKQNAAQQKQILDEIKLYELTALYCIRLNPQQQDPDASDFLNCVKRLYPSGPTLPRR